VDQTAHPIELSETGQAASPSFEDLAAQQGVTPIDDFASLLGKPVAGEESAEEFAALLRQWRREG
jgi:hypothetical protein